MSVKKRLILLLEDDPVQVMLFQGLATDVNDEMVSADNVFDAIKILKESSVAVCVVDLGVYRKFRDYEDIGGIEFIVQARRIAGDTMPIIVVTASRDPKVLIPCFDAGCDDYVLKDEGVHGAVTRLKAWMKSLPVDAEAMRSKRKAVLEKLHKTLDSL